MIHDTLTMIPGPTPVHRSVLEALARPTVSHQDPAFVERMSRALDKLRRIVMAGESAQPFVVAGAGTLAMEMALVNLVAPGERLLVVSHGYFGDRWCQIASSFGIDCDALRADCGETVPPEELERRLAGQTWAAVALTHVDTSTGSAAPLGAYVECLRGRSELLLLDGVSATAGMEERFDEWGLDALLGGAQKAFGAPPGVALLVVSERALQRRRDRQRVPAYYADLLRWLPVMREPVRYFSTPAVNELYALDAAFDLVLAEGLETRFARHARLARGVRAGMAALGFEPVTRAEALADTLSVLRYPQGIEDGAFRAGMAERGVVVAGSLGALAGKAVRIGHMGNIGAGEVCRLLEAAEATCDVLGGERATRGRALRAAASHL